LRLFDEIGGDLRAGQRAIWKQPDFSAVTVLSLALGIGATTAMFSLIYVVLLHPFPYADSDRIMNPGLINEENPQQQRWFAVTQPEFEQFGRARPIESLLGFRNVNMEISGNELPEEVAAVYLLDRVSHNRLERRLRYCAGSAGEPAAPWHPRTMDACRWEQLNQPYRSHAVVVALRARSVFRACIACCVDSPG
jgi:hypothetical protein